MLSKILPLTFLATSVLAAEPEKLTKLRADYESAITRATAPIQKAYADELEKLKIQYTKAGNLEDAVAVADEIKKFASPTKSNGDQASGTTASITPAQKMVIEDFLTGTKWRFGEPAANTGQEATFKDQGELLLTGNKSPWSWEITDEGLLKVSSASGKSVSVEITTTTTQILLPRFSADGQDRALSVEP